MTYFEIIANLRLNSNRLVHHWPNLVPRILRLYDQRLLTRRDAGEIDVLIGRPVTA